MKQDEPVLEVVLPVYQSDTGVVPEGVKEAVLRLTANLWNYVLKNRRGPLIQVGEFNLRLNDDAIFTDALRQDLSKYRRKATGVKVLYP